MRSFVLLFVRIRELNDWRIIWGSYRIGGKKKVLNTDIFVFTIILCRNTKWMGVRTRGWKKGEGRKSGYKTPDSLGRHVDFVLRFALISSSSQVNSICSSKKKNLQMVWIAQVLPLFLKIHHTFEFKESFSMFQTSSSAIVRVTLKFLHDNPCIYKTINTMILCRLNVRYK